MIYGDNYVEAYSPVEAYSVDARNTRVISGGTGDEVVITQGTRFLWRYDSTNQVSSGFTGYGWFAGVSNTPLAGFADDKDVNQAFENGAIDMTSYFRAWQQLVNSVTGNTYVQDFIGRIAIAAGSVEAARACYENVGEQ